MICFVIMIMKLFGDVYYCLRGILDLLEYFKINYGNFKVYIMENGKYVMIVEELF